MRTNEARWIESAQRWQINVTSDGERKTFTCATPGPKGKIAAERKADKWLESKNKKDVRFGVLWKTFLEYTKDNTGLANYTHRESVGRIWLLPRLQHRRLSTISLNDWQKCITDAYKAGRSKKTCINIRECITACCNYAVRDKREVEYPRGLTIPKDAPKRERNILQPDDIKKLFTIDTYMRYGKPEKAHFIHAWRMYVASGLRRGELCGLRRREDIKDGVLYVRRSINNLLEETKGKTENAQRCFLLTELEKSILSDQDEMLKQIGVISPWAFPGPDGQRANPNHISIQWRVYADQHGIKSSIHELRHTLISLAKNDMPEQLLKRTVGHSESMDTFGIYGHSVDGEMQQAAKILDAVFDRILK